jgi:hypothetical protein
VDARAGAMGGGVVSSPMWERILSMLAGSVMKAMICIC